MYNYYGVYAKMSENYYSRNSLEFNPELHQECFHLKINENKEYFKK